MAARGILIGLLLWASPAPAQVRAGGFVARQDGREIMRERYRFDGTTLEADVEVPARGVRLHTRTEYTPALSPARYRIAAYGGAGRAPVQELDATFGDSVRWTARIAGRPAAGAVAISRPFAVMQNLLFSHLAAILLRYSRPAGGVQVLDVWFPEGNRVGQLRMSFQGDSGTVEVGGTSLRVTTDRDGWLRSATVPAQRLVVEWRPSVTITAVDAPGADTTAPARVREEPFMVEHPGVRLAGTLALPTGVTGRTPVAVIVAGSGAVDRNGNADPVLRANTYAQLAWGLAERRIASIRYDKRGVGASRAGVRPETQTFDDFAGDVAAVVSAAAVDARLGPVILVGHSEGALLSLRAAALGAPVAGVVLLAGPGRPFADLVRDQLTRQVDSTAGRLFAELFPRYLAGQDPGPVPEYLRPLLLPVNRRFAASLAGIDPLAAIRAVRAPVLLVQGGSDVQVSLRDAQALRDARPDAQLAIIPQANHLFKAAANQDRMVELALYQDPTVPIVPDLVAAVGTWIDGLTRP